MRQWWHPPASGQSKALLMARTPWPPWPCATPTIHSSSSTCRQVLTILPPSFTMQRGPLPSQCGPVPRGRSNSCCALCLSWTPSPAGNQCPALQVAMMPWQASLPASFWCPEFPCRILWSGWLASAHWCHTWQTLSPGTSYPGCLAASTPQHCAWKNCLQDSCAASRHTWSQPCIRWTGCPHSIGWAQACALGMLRHCCHHCQWEMSNPLPHWPSRGQWSKASDTPALTMHSKASGGNASLWLLMLVGSVAPGPGKMVFNSKRRKYNLVATHVGGICCPRA